MRLILLGPAGAGKGTQARLIQQKHHVPQLSTGDMLRQAVREESEIGKKIKDVMDAGDLVPDEILVSMIEDRIQHEDCTNGFILDGFPRTEPQAEALDEMLGRLHQELETVILLQVEKDQLVKRLMGRFTCDTCGEGYHDEYKKPSVEGVCDVCGGTHFSRRADDAEESIAKRLNAFEEQTAKIIPYYEETGRLHRTDGMQDIKHVAAEIDAHLAQLNG